jgi:hypothetical protein
MPGTARSPTSPPLCNGYRVLQSCWIRAVFTGQSYADDFAAQGTTALSILRPHRRPGSSVELLEHGPTQLGVGAKRATSAAGRPDPVGRPGAGRGSTIRHGDSPVSIGQIFLGGVASVVGGALGALRLRLLPDTTRHRPKPRRPPTLVSHPMPGLPSPSGRSINSLNRVCSRSGPRRLSLSRARSSPESVTAGSLQHICAHSSPSRHNYWCE